MEAFPLMPDVCFETNKKAMREERRHLAVEILQASVAQYVIHVYNIQTHINNKE